LNCYQDKIQNDNVYEHFIAISTRTKKFAKPEVKVGSIINNVTPIQPHPLAALTGRAGTTVEDIT